jgi:hypothetical protein
MEPVQAIQPSGWVKDGGDYLPFETEYRHSGPVRRIVSNRGSRRKAIVSEINQVNISQPFGYYYPSTRVIANGTIAATCL